MIDSRVKANFIHYDDASGLDTLFQSADRRRYIARGDDVRFPLDSSFDNGRMVGVWDKGDDHIYSTDGGLQCRSVGDVERASTCSWKTIGQ